MAGVAGGVASIVEGEAEVVVGEGGSDGSEWRSFGGGDSGWVS